MVVTGPFQGWRVAPEPGAIHEFNVRRESVGGRTARDDHQRVAGASRRPPGVDYDLWLGPAPKRPSPRRSHGRT
jgi:hypothetical protein